jgi:hypothetical protein
MLEGSNVSYMGYAFWVSTQTVLYTTLEISTLLPGVDIHRDAPGVLYLFGVPGPAFLDSPGAKQGLRFPSTVHVCRLPSIFHFEQGR